MALNEQMGIDKIIFVGLCTDICVISNAILVKAFLPEVPIEVDACLLYTSRLLKRLSLHFLVAHMTKISRIATATTLF